MVLLVLMVCVGAPIVEELVYRGLLQRLVRGPHVDTSSPGWSSAAWFALIHFRPVEYPGLFVVRARHRRLPAASPAASACRWPTHVGFNVTGLLLAVR